MEETKYFYIAIDEGNDLVYFGSELVRLEEFEILQMIKEFKVRKRNKKLGDKIIKIYLEATHNRLELSRERLRKLGIQIDDGKPTKTRRIKEK
jgi:hypothetical protein